MSFLFLEAGVRAILRMFTRAQHHITPEREDIMKRLLTLAILFALAFAIPDAARAQDDTTRTGLKIGKTTIGGTIALGGRYTTIDGSAAGIVDVKAGIILDGTWGFGVGLAGTYLDRELSALVTDGTYHLSAGYSGFYVERYFRCNDELVISVSLLMGQGVITYQYDKEYRTEKAWKDEVIDLTTFAVFEPGISVQYRVGSAFWLQATASVRNTSPVQMLGTSESIMRKGSAGLSLRWDVF
jgi:hypothetical protein